jgi:hypothetical protein
MYEENLDNGKMIYSSVCVRWHIQSLFSGCVEDAAVNALKTNLLQIWKLMPCGLLLTLLPNIRDLELINSWRGWSYPDGHDPLGRFFALPMGTEVAKSKRMRQIELLTPIMGGIRNIKSLRLHGIVLSILNLPFDSLTHLDIDRIGAHDVRSRDDRKYLYRAYPSLKSLVIRSDVCEMAVSQRPKSPILLLRCTNLASFWFELHQQWPYYLHDWLDWPLAYNFDVIIQDLDIVRESLGQIRIDCPSFEREPYAFLGSGTGFTQFTRLKELHVVQRVLVPREYPKNGDKVDMSSVLPSTLESLTIASPDEKMLSWLENLVRSLSAFPHLKKVVLSCGGYLGLPAKWFLGLCSHPTFVALQAAGITVDIVQGEKRRAETDDGLPPPGIWLGSWSEDDWRTSVLGSDF